MTPEFLANMEDLLQRVIFCSDTDKGRIRCIRDLELAIADAKKGQIAKPSAPVAAVKPPPPVIVAKPPIESETVKKLRAENELLQHDLEWVMETGIVKEQAEKIKAELADARANNAELVELGNAGVDLNRALLAARGAAGERFDADLQLLVDEALKRWQRGCQQ